MQYKKTTLLFTRRLSILFGSFLVLLFSLFIFPSLNQAEAGSTPGLSCPPGWKLTAFGSSVCCPNNATVTTNAFQYCRFEADNSPAPSITVGLFSSYYCDSGSLKLDFVSSFCFTPGSSIEDKSITSPGKVFVECKTMEPSVDGGTTSPYRVEVDQVPGAGNYNGIEVKHDGVKGTNYIELDMCHGEQSAIIIGVDEYNNGVCFCPNGTKDNAPRNQEQCNSTCGGTFYGGANICNGPSCCNNDAECLACVGQDDSSVTGNIYTSLGCINPTRNGIVVWLIRIALILTSAIGVFRFIQASFLIRSGDPEKIKEGQEIVTSAIIALVLVLVSVPLLQFIGVNILGIFPAGSF